MKQRKQVNLTRLISLLFLGGCTSLSQGVQKTVLDNSVQGKSLPNWTRETKVSWSDQELIYFRSTYAVRGDQRVNGCYDLAKLNVKENLLSEMNNEIRGELNLADSGIAENTDPMITKAIQSSIEGKVRGLRITEEAYERYIVNHTERIDCFVLAEMTKGDYQKLKISVLTKLSSVSEDVSRALQKRQAEFFGSEGAAISIPEATKKSLKRFFKVDDLKPSQKLDDLTPQAEVKSLVGTGTMEAVRSNVAQIARAFQGVRYQYGSNLVNDGMIDCSALVKKVYEVVGINLPRTSPEQFSFIKAEAVTGQPIEGDLVFFDGFRGKGEVSHVGIMVGNDEFINANGNDGEVKVDSLSSPYWTQKFLGAKRVITERNFQEANRKIVSLQ